MTVEQCAVCQLMHRKSISSTCTWFYSATFHSCFINTGVKQYSRIDLTSCISAVYILTIPHKNHITMLRIMIFRLVLKAIVELEQTTVRYLEIITKGQLCINCKENHKTTIDT